MLDNNTQDDSNYNNPLVLMLRRFTCPSIIHQFSTLKEPIKEEEFETEFARIQEIIDSRKKDKKVRNINHSIPLIDRKYTEVLHHFNNGLKPC